MDKLDKVSFSDLYAMYLFMLGDRNNKGFGKVSKDDKAMAANRLHQVESEIYDRLYGRNIFISTVGALNESNSALTPVKESE